MVNERKDDEAVYDKSFLVTLDDNEPIEIRDTCACHILEDIQDDKLHFARRVVIEAKRSEEVRGGLPNGKD